MWNKLKAVLIPTARIGAATIVVRDRFRLCDSRYTPGQITVDAGGLSRGLACAAPISQTYRLMLDPGAARAWGIRVWRLTLDDQRRAVSLDAFGPPDGGEWGISAGLLPFPKYGEEYFKQITAEQLVTRIVKGYRRPEWQKTRDRNEALDARCYARAAAAVYGMDRFHDVAWKTLEGRLDELSRQVGQPPRPPEPARPPKRPIRGRFLNLSNGSDRFRW